MIKNIIFDFDGVVADSEVLVGKAFCKYLKDYNIDFSEKEFSTYAGKKTVEVVSELSSKFNIKDQNKFYKDIMMIANKIYSEDLIAIDGIKIFLESNNYKYFIGSNSIKKRIMIGLNKIDLNNFFPESNIFSFDMVLEPKPAPDVYLKVIEHHNLQKNETIIIEDSAVGTQAGVAAGIKVVGLTAGGHWHSFRSNKELYDYGAFIVVENYSKLREEIDKI